MEEPRKQNVLVSLLPHIGLVLANPIREAFTVERVHDAVQADGFQSVFEPEGREFGCVRHALIKPVDGGAEWLSIPIQIDIHAALRGERHRFDVPAQSFVAGEKSLTGFAEFLPEIFGVLFVEPWRGDKVGFDGNLDHVHHRASCVEESTTHGLSPSVKDEDQVRV